LVLRHLPPAPPTPPPAPALPPKALLMIRSLGDYGSLMIFPYKLFMERQVFAAPGLEDPPDPVFYATLGIAGGLLAAAFAAGALCPGRGRALRRFGAAWFVAGYLPVSNLFPLNASVAEHWLYLPSIGFLLFLAGVLMDLAIVRSKRAAPAVLALVAICAGALAARTYLRAFDWSDELTFFRQTIRDGGDVPRARDALATAYGHAHDDASAIAVLRDICAHYPKVLSARINLAMALARHGHPDEAATMLEAIIPMLLDRGNAPEVLVTVRALDAAESGPSWPARRQQLLAKALRKFPDAWDLVQLVATELQNRQQNAQALALVANFAASHWWSAQAHYAAGCLELQLDRPAQALDAWRDAARLDVHDAEAPAAEALLNLDEKHLDAARDLGKEAVRRQPDSPKQRILFAHILEALGDAQGAAGQLAIARQLTAANPPPP
jgi:tetratricopeptide (TPR) repeat protein